MSLSSVVGGYGMRGGLLLPSSLQESHDLDRANCIPRKQHKAAITILSSPTFSHFILELSS